MKKPTIICTTPPGQGLLFYLDVDGERYFLFSQRYRSGIEKYFSKGVSLNDILANKMRGDDCVKKVVSKLPTYIKYVEKEYDITILNQTMKKQRRICNA